MTNKKEKKSFHKIEKIRGSRIRIIRFYIVPVKRVLVRGSIIQKSKVSSKFSVYNVEEYEKLCTHGDNSGEEKKVPFSSNFEKPP